MHERISHPHFLDSLPPEVTGDDVELVIPPQELQDFTRQVDDLAKLIREGGNGERATKSTEMQEMMNGLTYAVSELTEWQDRQVALKSIAGALYGVSCFDYRLEKMIAETAESVLRVALQEGADQAAVFAAWFAPTQEQARKEGYRQAINHAINAGLPLDEAGAEALRERALEPSLHYTFLIEDGERFHSGWLEEIPERARDLIIEMSIETASTAFCPYVRYMSHDQQAAYLDAVLYDSHSSVVLPSALKMIPEGALQLSADELAVITERCNRPDVMLLFAAQGVPGIDMEEWAQQAALEARTLGRPEMIMEALDVCRGRQDLGAAPEGTYERLLTILYGAARQAGRYDMLIIGLSTPGSRDRKNPFLNHMRQRGDDYVELYRHYCRQMAEARSEGVLLHVRPLDDAVRWAGVDSVELGRQLLDAYVEELGSFAVEDCLREDTFYAYCSELVREVLQMNRDEMVQYIAAKGMAIELAQCAKYDIEAIERWLAQGGMNEVVAALGSERMTPALFSQGVDVLMRHEELLNETEKDASVRHLLRVLEQTKYAMLNYPTLEGFRMVQALNEGVVSDEARRLGVTQAGVQGVNQLRSLTADIIGDIQKVQLTPEVLQRVQLDTFYRSLVLSQYRVHEGEYRRDGAGGADWLIDDYLAHQAEITPLHPAFVPRTYEVRKHDTQRGEVQLTTDAVERLQVITGDIIAADGGRAALMYDLLRELERQQRLLQQELTHMSDGSDEQYNALPAKAQRFYRGNAERRLKGARGAIALLEQGDASFRELFVKAQTMDACVPLLRRLAIAEALDDMNEPARESLMAIHSETAGVHEMRQLHDFLERIRAKHRFSDKKTMHRYNAMLSGAAFRRMIDRYEGHYARKETIDVTFVPDRGLAMELSGYVADACWTQEASITRRFPQVTAVIMKRPLQGSPVGRLIGSLLLIETESTDGDKVLVMRGINPIENQINKMDGAAFLDAAVSYCREMAGAMGCIPAIVLDQQGGASTNREAVFRAIDQQYLLAEPVIIDNPDATFNGYALQGIVKQIT